MLQQITPCTQRNLTTSKRELKGRLLFFSRADTPRDKTTNKVTLLNFRLIWAELHFGSSGLWLLWSGLSDGAEKQSEHSADDVARARQGACSCRWDSAGAGRSRGWRRGGGVHREV